MKNNILFVLIILGLIWLSYTLYRDINLYVDGIKFTTTQIIAKLVISAIPYYIVIKAIIKHLTK